ncbi:very conserved membrane protein [Lacticaseibacillus casei 21/1]|nr:very conserved membrane protein [Lacticaseibacillus casei 21/1]
MHEKNKLSWAHELAWLLGIVIMALIVLSPQLSYHALAVGDDWEFHWNRFYEAAMQLKTGKFNFFQSLYSFRQSGRIINAVYGSAFAYCHGFILIIAKTWFRAEIISSFLCLVTAGSGMYF